MGHMGPMGLAWASFSSSSSSSSSNPGARSDGVSECWSTGHIGIAPRVRGVGSALSREISVTDSHKSHLALFAGAPFRPFAVSPYPTRDAPE